MTNTGDLLLGLRPLVIEKYSEFFQKCKATGYNIRITSGLRTFAEQTALYAQGRTADGPIVTNAKAGQSMHNFGIAYDICVDNLSPTRTDWDKIGLIGKTLGFTWGGDFTTIDDFDHFELLCGYYESQIMAGNVDWTKWNVPAFVPPPEPVPEPVTAPEPLPDTQFAIVQNKSIWEMIVDFIKLIFKK